MKTPPSGLWLYRGVSGPMLMDLEDDLNVVARQSNVTLETFQAALKIQVFVERLRIAAAASLKSVFFPPKKPL